MLLWEIYTTVIKDIYATIKRINKETGMTILLVEQDTQRAMKTGEYCHVMLKGEVVLSGKPKDLGDEEIKKAYFGI